MKDLFGEEIDDYEERRDTTAADRVARSVAKRSEIGPLPPVRDPGRKERCAASLVEFGTVYGMATPDWRGMLERPPSERLADYASDLQTAIEHAGFVHRRLARGSGKSTWAKLAVAWGVATGRIHYPVIVAATAGLAQAILADVWRFFEESPLFGEDFPEVSHPIVSLGGKFQRMATQTLDGIRTMIHKTASNAVLPTVAGSPCSGSVIAAKGSGEAVRGLVRGSMRPDFVFLDDIQTREDAMSATVSRKICEWVKGDILGLGGARQISAVMTSTPICDGDVSEHFADRNLEPAWDVESEPMVVSWPTRMDLWDRYMEMLRADMISGDMALSSSRGFYEGRREEMDAGAEVFDPGNFDPRLELSGIQHAFNLLARMGEGAFQAECMLAPPKPVTLVALRTEAVAGKVNHCERFHLPRGTVSAVAFVDVMATGLHYVCAAFGRGQVGAVIDYGRFPERGRLVPENTPQRETEAILARGLTALAERLASLPLVDAHGHPARLQAVWFDHRWNRNTVVAVANLLRRRTGVEFWTCAGFDSTGYNGGRGRNVIARGDNVDFREIDGQKFAAQNSDYWKEQAQSAFLGEPLAPGSMSIFGDSAAEHAAFADQITAERLSDKAKGARGHDIYRWTLRPGSQNHWLDCLAGCMASASWRRLWDSSDVAPSVLAVAEAAGGIRIAPSSPIYQARPRMAVAPRAAARRRHSARPQPA